MKCFRHKKEEAIFTVHTPNGQTKIKHLCGKCMRVFHKAIQGKLSPTAQAYLIKNGLEIINSDEGLK